MTYKIGDKVRVIDGEGWSLKVGDILEVTSEREALIQLPKGEISIRTASEYPECFEKVENPWVNTVIVCTSREQSAQAQLKLFESGCRWGSGWSGYTRDVGVRDYFEESVGVLSLYVDVEGRIGYDQAMPDNALLNGRPVYVCKTEVVVNTTFVKEPEPVVSIRGLLIPVSEVKAALAEVE